LRQGPPRKLPLAEAEAWMFRVKQPPTVFIVDDDPDIGRALARLLRAAGYHARTFRSARTFLSEHDPGVPGCVILDLAMPDLDGLEVQATLAATGCPRPIIFLTGHPTIASSVSAIRAGAVDFLAKPIEEQRLLAALDEALRIDESDRRVWTAREAIMERLRTLTPREKQVLEYVVSGWMNKQIAADLGTVEKTIKVHRARVMHKLGARSLPELVQIASTVGVVFTRGGRAATSIASSSYAGHSGSRPSG
jgi:FixJ family two-component response regulator